MSYIWPPIITPQTYLTDFRTSHKQTAEEFKRTFYSIFTCNSPNYVTYFHPSAQITYNDVDIIGAGHLIEALKMNGISKLSFSRVHISSQALNESVMVMNVTGSVSYNDSIFSNRFTETIVLSRDNYNKGLITNYIFKLAD